MMGGHFVESLIGWFVTAWARRAVRNSPLSRFPYIYEGTTPISAISAKTNTRVPTSFSSSTYLASVAVSTSGHRCFPTSSSTPRCSLVTCPQCTTGPSKSTSTSSTRTAPAAHSPSHATSPTANAVRSRLTTITALFAFVIVYPPLLCFHHE